MRVPSRCAWCVPLFECAIEGGGGGESERGEGFRGRICWYDGDGVLSKSFLWRSHCLSKEYLSFLRKRYATWKTPDIIWSDKNGYRDIGSCRW